MYSTAALCTPLHFSTPLYRCRLLFILVDYFSSLSTSPYPCPLSLLVYSSAVCICLYSSVSLVLVHFSSLPYSSALFSPSLFPWRLLCMLSLLLCILVDSSASLSALCIRIYSFASVSTPMPLCLLLCLLVDTSASLFPPLHECLDPCFLFLSP
jgi:hypothetical protein